MKIICSTQFDITATGVTGHFKPSRVPFVDSAGGQVLDIECWNRSRNQQRNWETLMQVIGLRTQVDFGRPVKKQDLWWFDFAVDNGSVYATVDDALGLLRSDCQGVPMLTGLDEIVHPGQFLEPGSNIWFDCAPINNSQE